MDLAGRTALLTGATGGLGRAIAAGLAGRGAKLVLSSRKEGELKALAGELPGDGHRVIPADLAEIGAAEGLAADAGEVDVLVANAGLPGSGRLSELTAEQVARALRVNLEAPILLAHALEPQMVDRGQGHMVFISSLNGKSVTPMASIYAATKFGLRGFALGLRADLDRLGVGVSIISPGLIREAGMFADTGAKPALGLGTGSPEEVAAAVVRAIERNKVEIAVGPARQRFLSHVALVSPRLNVKTVSSGAARKAAAAVVSQQTDKR